MGPLQVASAESGSVVIVAGLLLTSHAVPLFAQRAHGLRPRVVELGRLPDHDGPAAEDEDAL